MEIIERDMMIWDRNDEGFLKTIAAAYRIRTAPVNGLDGWWWTIDVLMTYKQKGIDHRGNPTNHLLIDGMFLMAGTERGTRFIPLEEAAETPDLTGSQSKDPKFYERVAKFLKKDHAKDKSLSWWEERR